jgi:hypothetical protein
MTPKQKAIDKAIDAACDSGQILHRWQIEAFLASLVASGFAIVPVEATDDAIKAGREAMVEQSGKTYFPSNANMARVYSAMIAAAQKEQG